MKKLLFILMLLPVIALSQSPDRKAFQEIHVDTLRPNHYGPGWAIVIAWHDTISVKIFKDSLLAKKVRIGPNGSMLDSAKVRTDSLSFYSGGIAYNAYKNAPSGGSASGSWWEIDGNGNMMPRKSGGEGDTYWELDAQGNLMSKAW
jgi:hypothetical protein